MDKLEQIEELRKESKEYWDKYMDTKFQIRRLEKEDCNYEGKYIFIQEYGYMYVTWQHYDEHSVYNDERMFFQGFAFKSFITDYRDDFWFDLDACEEWNIPIDSFQGYVRDNKIIELTKEEFLEAYNQKIEKLKAEFSSMLEYCEKIVKLNKDEEENEHLDNNE